MSHRRKSRRIPQPILETIERRILFATSMSTLAFFPTNDVAQGGTVVDSKGDIFGTTPASGISDGTVYELPAGSNTISTVAYFNGNDGDNPGSALTIDAAGDIFGTTSAGGMYGYGAVWELPASSTTITRLASYNGQNGNQLGNGLAMHNGNIYVIVQAGSNGDGAVLELPKNSDTFMVLGTFGDSSSPIGRPVLDSAGDLFGVTGAGGTNGLGSIYEITASGEDIDPLASFTASDPTPQGDLIIDSAGDIFGTTISNSEGETISSVFENPAGTSNIISLGNPQITTDGTYIEPGLVRDSNGDLFGATTGAVGDPSTIFEIPNTGGTFTPGRTLVNIPEMDNDGINTNAATGYLGMDTYGNLYGTTQSTDPSTDDSIFEISGAGAAQVGSQLVIAQQPTTTVINNIITPPITLDVLDSNGNLVTTNDSPVTVRINTGTRGAVLGGTYTVDAVDGVATFSNLNINATGNYTLSFTAPNLSSATTQSFRIAPSPLDGSQLVFTLPPAALTPAGQKLQEIVVTAVEPSPSVHTKGTVTLSITNGPTGGKIIGTKAVALRSGVADFKNISFDIAGTYTLEATDTASYNTTPTTFAITATTPKKMIFSLQPTPSKISPIQSFSVNVELEDKYGNVATEDFSTVAITLAGGKQLADQDFGTLSATVDNGVAAFDDLTVATAGHYTIKAVDASDRFKATSKGLTVT